jgi:predicted acylesterase/phospholipase RssA
MTEPDPEPTEAPAATPEPPKPKAPPDTLVVGGGGIKGVAALGAAARLAEAGALDGVTTFVGTSAGALVCAVLATRRDLKDVMGVLIREKYAPDYDLASVGTGYGLDTGKNLARWIARILGGKDYTFADVRREFGTCLIVCVTDLTSRTAAYLGPDTHPDMEISLALRATCAVPLYFAAVRHGDRLFVDGAIMDNFPMAWAARRGRDCLGICIRGHPAPITSLDSYVGALIDCIVQSEQSESSPVVFVDTPRGVGTLNLALSPAGLKALFACGFAEAGAYLDRRDGTS